MKVFTRRALFIGGLLLLGLRPGVAAAQHGLPARTQAFTVIGVDSLGQTATIRLDGKSVGPKGRQYAGKCIVMASAQHPETSRLAGEWNFTQNSSTAVAAGPRPAVGGIGTRPGAKPWKSGQKPKDAGQVVNFTIDPLPDGGYTVLLMDLFNDDMLEFKYQPPAK